MKVDFVCKFKSFFTIILSLNQTSIRVQAVQFEVKLSNDARANDIQRACKKLNTNSTQDQEKVQNQHVLKVT